jgi:hypothetical protein
MKDLFKFNSIYPHFLLSVLHQIIFSYFATLSFSVVMITSFFICNFLLTLMLGLSDFDPESNDFRWDGVEDNIVQGFSHEDRFVYRFLSCKEPGTDRTDILENNLANQFLMIPNCCGSFVIYKSETQTSSPPPPPLDSLNLLENNNSNSQENETENTFLKRKDSNMKYPTLSRREIWEITEYRHFCSFDGVVSDRIHRINMQRKEGLMTLKKTDFTMIDS